MRYADGVGRMASWLDAEGHIGFRELAGGAGRRPDAVAVVRLLPVSLRVSQQRRGRRRRPQGAAHASICGPWPWSAADSPPHAQQGTGLRPRPRSSGRSPGSGQVAAVTEQLGPQIAGSASEPRPGAVRAGQLLEPGDTSRVDLVLVHQPVHTLPYRPPTSFDRSATVAAH
jgi:hypothetical protein